MNNPLPPKTVLLLSGGIDSTVLLYHLLKWDNLVHAALVNYGQRHIKELDCAKATCLRLDVPFTELTIPCPIGHSLLTDGKGDVIVPNRNMILLSCAVPLALKARAEVLLIGCNKDDSARFPDCRPEFIDAMSWAVKQAGYSLSVAAPLGDKSKKAIVALGRTLGVPFESTWSCYNPIPDPCGRCLACRLREEALS